MKSPTPKKSPAKNRSASKTSAVFWAQKVFLESKGDWQSSNYFVRIQVGKERRKLRLESTTKEEAGREALKEYLKILAKGWPKEEAPGIVAAESSGLSESPTVGDWISLATLKALAQKKSVEKYAESLRTIVGEILGLRRARKLEQRAKIDAFRISDLTKEALKQWLENRLRRARELDPVQAKRANNTARTLAANAKALFTEQILEAIGVSEESLTRIPFRGVKLPAKIQTRYTSRFNARTLLDTAKAELGNAPVPGDEDSAFKYELWKIIYLALVAGLRYNEIDCLRVQEIFPDEGRISIVSHEGFRTKTIASEGDVMVGKEASMVLKEMTGHNDGEWLVKGGASKRSQSYRAGLYHDAAVLWLREYEERGIRPLADVPKPIHELRKEAGTLVNSEHGLNEAKNFLRHGSIATTAAYYVGSKGQITTGLG